LPTFANLPTSGALNAGKPSAYGGGQRGVQGGEAPMAGGVGGVPPQKQKRERIAHISNPATSGAQNAGEPSANGGGERGVEGGEAPMVGSVGGVPPQKQKRERIAHISNPATSGALNAGKPSANGGGQRGVHGGEAPMAGGVGGVPPQKQKRERVAHISNPATSGTLNAGEPSANGGGQRGGPGGRSPHGRGRGGFAPKISKKGHPCCQP